MRSLIFLLIIFYTSSFSHFVHGQLTATLTYQFYSPVSNYQNITKETQSNGFVSTRGSQSPVYNCSVFTIIDRFGKYDACQPANQSLNYSNAIAIIHRGNCAFSVKITRAKQYGAIAVIIYEPLDNGQDGVDMLQNNSDILAVYVQRTIGVYLFDLANNNQTRLNLTIEPGPVNRDQSNSGGLWSSSRGVILFVVISVSILIFLCITCVSVYFCRQRRTRTSKDRLQSRLLQAAKKALNKIPLVTITENNRSDESCVICLEAIKVGDTVRQIACGHTFHQQCVDPWLITNRHCPLCNLDILVAYRIPVPESNNTRQIHPENSSTNQSSSISTTAVTTTVAPAVNWNELPMQTTVPIPSISASVKDEHELSVRIHNVDDDDDDDIRRY